MQEEKRNTVLAVDDQVANLSILFEYLNRAGFKVLVAKDGASALERARLAAPDIILLDVRLPDMDGFEVCRRLKEGQDTRDIPIIFLTALDEAVNRVKGFELHAVDYITKPFEPQDVLARVRNHLAIHNLRQSLEARNAELEREVARRAQAEQALRESEARLELSIAGSNGGQWHMELDPDEPHALPDEIYISPRLKGLLGYADDEFPNSLAAWEGLVAPQDLAALRESSRQHRLGQIELYEVEYRARHKDGSLRWIRSRGKVQRDERGRPLRFAGIDWDVTERVQAQERLEEMVQERTRELHDAQAELLRQEKLAVLGKLAGGVAHELRNPLGNITNSAYFLNMVLADVEPEAQEALRILDEEVRVCERIINSLLNFARTRSPVQRYTNLHDVIQETLSHTDMPENVQLAYSADDELPPVLTDPEQLSMVLGNIVRNAIQAMTLSRSPSTSSPSTSSGHRAETPEGGRLSITVKEMDAEWAVVSISDTGTGMSQEHLQQVFEPFFTTRARGIGLGLALARDLVEANGGRIEAQSQLGQGSVFSVYLPLAWPAA